MRFAFHELHATSTLPLQAHCTKQQPSAYTNAITIVRWSPLLCNWPINCEVWSPLLCNWPINCEVWSPLLCNRPINCEVWSSLLCNRPINCQVWSPLLCNWPINCEVWSQLIGRVWYPEVDVVVWCDVVCWIGPPYM